jgi:hypothetical protein
MRGKVYANGGFASKYFVRRFHALFCEKTLAKEINKSCIACKLGSCWEALHSARNHHTIERLPETHVFFCLLCALFGRCSDMSGALLYLRLLAR